ncbi:G-protein coupled receptor 1 [Trichoplax sp. H2]|nr:G-protein coupled receptor 1 [Trichoplax sp. H2]|eukprot:RDD39779.1 G-protein coupled receptor 1 [Trichoplax sp. H2]
MKPANYSCFLGDESNCTNILLVKRILASLSIAGSFAMIFLIWLFKKYQFFAQRLLLYLSIACLINSITFLMADSVEPSPKCTFEAVMITISVWAILLWVILITFNLYWSAVAKKSTERFEIYYHLIGWGIPVVISVIPFSSNKYGPAGVWCWIENDPAWRFAIWYGPRFLIIFVLFLVYFYIFKYVRKQTSMWTGCHERERELMRENVKPLMAYPLVYLLLSIFPLVNRIQNTVQPDNASFTLYLLQIVSSSLKGAGNAIVFSMDKETFKHLNLADLRNAWSHRCSKSVVREYSTD